MFVVGKRCPICDQVIVYPDDHGYTYCVISTSVSGPPKKEMAVKEKSMPSSGPQEFRSSTDESGNGTLNVVLQSPKSEI